jgi:hypothetical protein
VAFAAAKLSAYQVAVEALGQGVPRARTGQLALETATFKASARARSAQVVVEVARRSGLGADYLPGGLFISSYTLEAVGDAAPQITLGQLAVEAVSRSGLGADYVTPESVFLSSACIEVASRSGLGANPLLADAASIGTFLIEVVSFSSPNPDDRPPNPVSVGTLVLEVASSAAPELAGGCGCVITPELAPAKYLMRRPGRFK